MWQVEPAMWQVEYGLCGGFAFQLKREGDSADIRQSAAIGIAADGRNS